MHLLKKSAPMNFYRSKFLSMKFFWNEFKPSKHFILPNDLFEEPQSPHLVPKPPRKSSSNQNHKTNSFSHLDLFFFDFQAHVSPTNENIIIASKTARNNINFNVKTVKRWEKLLSFHSLQGTTHVTKSKFSSRKVIIHCEAQMVLKIEIKSN